MASDGYWGSCRFEILLYRKIIQTNKVYEDSYLLHHMASVVRHFLPKGILHGISPIYFIVSIGFLSGTSRFFPKATLLLPLLMLRSESHSHSLVFYSAYAEQYLPQ